MKAQNPFPYEEWENLDGKNFEARLERLKGDDALVLQAKNGGKRYTLKTESLSQKSQYRVVKYVDDCKNILDDKDNLDAEYIYRSVALGLQREAQKKLLGKKLTFGVKGFRISTDKKVAYLKLEHDLFAEIRAHAGDEFFKKRNALHARSAIKGKYVSRYWWWSTDYSDDDDLRGNRESIQIAEVKGYWRFRFSEQVRLSWGKVGVDTGAMISK